MLEKQQHTCGCNKKYGKEHKQWKGYKGISGQYWNTIQRNADGSKNRRTLSFNITKKYIRRFGKLTVIEIHSRARSKHIRWHCICDCGKFADVLSTHLLSSSTRQCALSGLPIKLPDRYKQTFTASIDRIDSSKGYVKGNVQWVHKDINMMKRNLNQARFVEFCLAVASTCGGEIK